MILNYLLAFKSSGLTNCGRERERGFKLGGNRVHQIIPLRFWRKCWNFFQKITKRKKQDGRVIENRRSQIGISDDVGKERSKEWLEGFLDPHEHPLISN